MTRLPSTAPGDPTHFPRRGKRRCLSALLPLLLCLATGCAAGGFTPPWMAATPDAKKETPTFADNGVKLGTIYSKWVIDPEMQKELDAAKVLFEQKKYAEAEVLFHKIYQIDRPWYYWTSPIGIITGEAMPDSALDSEELKKAKKETREKNRKRENNPVCEAAIYYEAECQRLQKNYRDAELTYTKLLTDYQRSQYATRVCQGLFEIADYWLIPTREQMKQYEEQLQGKRWFVTPAMWFHYGKDMPLLDAEGSAMQALNAIRLHDIKGPLGERSLMYLGTINFFRQEYKEADFYFSALYKEYPNSKDAAKALKQSVICKQLMTGGPLYDNRGVEESKKLLLTSIGAYPELAKEEKWIENQLRTINFQQAERDLKIAEFYQRTGHPGSAYFYYELVCRRYPGTTFAATATQCKSELKAKVEKEQQKAPPATAPPAPATPVLQGPQAPPAASGVPAPPRMLPDLGSAPPR